MPHHLMIPFSTLGMSLGLLIFYLMPSDPRTDLFPILLGAASLFLLCLMVIFQFLTLKSTWPIICVFISVFLILGLWRGWDDTKTTYAAVQDAVLYIENAPLQSKGQAFEKQLVGQVINIEPHRIGRLLHVRLKSDANIQLYDRSKGLLSDQLFCKVTFSVSPKWPSAPAYIGGFDQRRLAFFSKTVARGFIDKVELIDCPPLSLGQRASAALIKFRISLASKYLNRLEAPENALAIALLFGYRGTMPPAIKESFRASGLAHLLAISGLHMALFAGGLYALIRFILACIPALALRGDIRVPSALIALLGATFYLLMSGAGFATQRAYIMISLFLIAIVFRRPALTMHNVMTAALIILMLEPSAIVAPGFLMSFSAVITLIRFYNWQFNRGSFEPHLSNSHFENTLRKIYHYGLALILTSLVAGFATGIFALYFFGRGATYGIVANALAMPVFSFLTMPILMLSTLVIHLPGFSVFMTILAGSLRLIIEIADWVSGFSGAVWRVPQLSDAYLLCAILFFMGLAGQWWVGKRRLFVLVLIIIAFTGTRALQPDLYILGRGSDVAFVDTSGELSMVQAPRNKFITQQWFDGAGQRLKVLNAVCAKQLCQFVLKGSVKVGIAYSNEAAQQGCEKFDLVISPRRRPSGCKANFISTSNFMHHRVYMIYKGTQNLGCDKSWGNQGQDDQTPKWQICSTHVQGRRIWHKWRNEILAQF